MKNPKKEQNMKPDIQEQVDSPKKDPIEKNGEKKQQRLLVLGSSVGIFVIIAALFGVIYFVTRASQDPVETEVIVLDNRSADEKRIDNLLNGVEEDLNSIDANEDFSEFEDSEFAVDGGEAELDEAIEDIDQMLDDLEQLENGLDDFSEEDF